MGGRPAQPGDMMQMEHAEEEPLLASGKPGSRRHAALGTELEWYRHGEQQPRGNFEQSETGGGNPASILVSAAVALGLAAGVFWVAMPPTAREATPPSIGSAEATPTAVAALDPGAEEPAAGTAQVEPESPEGTRRLSRTLREGETVSEALLAQEVPYAVVVQVVEAMRPLYDFRRARAGHRYRLHLSPRGEVEHFAYRVSPVERYHLEPDGDQFRALREEVPILRRPKQLAGVVSTTIHQAMEQLGEDRRVAADFASIFAWDLDFSRNVYTGDRFRLLYERNYVVEEQQEYYLGPGRILAAAYEGEGGSFRAIYYEIAPGQGGYFRPDGHSVERKFLAAPLNYNRISSKYTRTRFHPILKVHRPHFGIDYAAPSGTPVWAVGDGTVVSRGWGGGFGRLVKIRHSNGYVSYYAHLSRYAAGLHVGQAVRQKQVIGYVGKTGLATGPHLCFRIQKNGRYVNPSFIDAPAANPIPVDHWEAFRAVRDVRMNQMGRASLVSTEEAM